MDYFDLHCDTLYELSQYALYRHGEPGSLLCSSGQLDLQRVRCYDRYAQIFALFCGSSPITDPEDAHVRLTHLLEIAAREFEENAAYLRLCRTAEDLLQAQTDKKAAAFLSIEGAELLQTPEDFVLAQNAGVRFVTLTWNHRTCYGCGAVTDNHAGLTADGRELVCTLVRCGMIADVSHLSERGFWDVMECTDAPVLATHSNSQAMCPHVRNLTDEQFCELCRRGGIVGINLYAPFLAKGGQAGLNDVVRHIAHFCELGGENHLAIGADFDGCDRLPRGIHDVADLPKLAETLRQNGFSAAMLHNLFYENMNRFVKTHLTEQTVIDT